MKRFAALVLLALALAGPVQAQGLLGKIEQLFVFGTSFSFAVMLATVLAGIGLGGLAASWWLRMQPPGRRVVFQGCRPAAFACWPGVSWPAASCWRSRSSGFAFYNCSIPAWVITRRIAPLG